MKGYGMEKTNYDIARDLIEKYKGTDLSWDSPVGPQLAAMQAAAMLAIVDAIKEPKEATKEPAWTGY